ncbi:MAG: hypothetical protein D6769_03055 [Methanobacteriota archaeon]|nr:MAG: hypothetical protein D6769_03055 [Euryarchaeota archaeon]
MQKSNTFKMAVLGLSLLVVVAASVFFSSRGVYAIQAILHIAAFFFLFSAIGNTTGWIRYTLMALFTTNIFYIGFVTAEYSGDPSFSSIFIFFSLLSLFGTYVFVWERMSFKKMTFSIPFIVASLLLLIPSLLTLEYDIILEAMVSVVGLALLFKYKGEWLINAIVAFSSIIAANTFFELLAAYGIIGSVFTIFSAELVSALALFLSAYIYIVSKEVLQARVKAARWAVRE